MMDQPTMRELLEAVRDFIEKRAMPELKGHTAFHARVAANALGIVLRELSLGGKAGADEMARLTSLLNQEGTLDELNRELCRRIRAGEITLDTPGLAEHLEFATRDKIAIDQPNYSGRRQAELRER